MRLRLWVLKTFHNLTSSINLFNKPYFYCKFLPHNSQRGKNFIGKILAATFHTRPGMLQTAQF